MAKICLIATHDPWMIQLLRTYAEVSGFQIVQAMESQDVLPLTQHEQPAVVLLQMDLAGYLRCEEVLQNLKTDTLTRNIPVILVSWQNQSALDGLDKDASGFLQEPVTYESFVSTLHQAGVCCLAEEQVVPLSDLVESETVSKASSRRKKG